MQLIITSLHLQLSRTERSCTIFELYRSLTSVEQTRIVMYATVLCRRQVYEIVVILGEWRSGFARRGWCDDWRMARRHLASVTDAGGLSVVQTTHQTK